MIEKDDRTYILHILDCIDAIEIFSKNIKKETLLTNREKKSAIIREIEIIGEATKNISKELKDKNPNVQWKLIVGTRDKMIHHYFGVDVNIVWEIIKNEIPLLKKQIIKIKKDLLRIVQ